MVRDPATGVARPLQVGDHIRVIGRWVLDHHPEWCDNSKTMSPPEPSRCSFAGPLKAGATHAELHPIRWNQIELVGSTAIVTEETVSLAAPLHEEVFLGFWKWAANEFAGVASKIFVNEGRSNYHNTMTANANIKAPALPQGFTGDPLLIGFDETIFANDTGVSNVRSVTATADGILVSVRIDAPLSVPTLPLGFPPLPLNIADPDDPARNRSIFQARYIVYWLRRLRIIDENGVPYDTDNPFNPAWIQLPLTAVGLTPFLVYAQTRGPSPVVIKSVRIEDDAEGAFEMAPVNELAVPPGFAADLVGNFKPSHPGTFNARLIILSNDPANERIEIVIQGKAVALQEIGSPP